jgi:hypothetical protein
VAPREAVGSVLAANPNAKSEILDCWLLLAESHLTRGLVEAMVRRMEALALPAGWRAAGK